MPPLMPTLLICFHSLLDLLEHAYPESAAESALNLDVAEFAHTVINLSHIAPTPARYAPFAHSFPVASAFTPLGLIYEADVSELSIIDIMEDLVDFALFNGLFLCIRCEIVNPLATPLQVDFYSEAAQLRPVYLSRSNGTISAQIALPGTSRLQALPPQPQFRPSMMPWEVSFG